jgi:hypothetical protein
MKLKKVIKQVSLSRDNTSYDDFNASPSVVAWQTCAMTVFPITPVMIEWKIVSGAAQDKKYYFQEVKDDGDTSNPRFEVVHFAINGIPTMTVYEGTLAEVVPTTFSPMVTMEDAYDLVSEKYDSIISDVCYHHELQNYTDGKYIEPVYIFYSGSVPFATVGAYSGLVSDFAFESNSKSQKLLSC